MDSLRVINSPMREKMIEFFDMILRVPPLFVMDAILNLKFVNVWPIEPIILPPLGFQLLVLMFALASAFFMAEIVFCLSTRQIVDVYAFLMSGCLLFMSYWFNSVYIADEIETSNYYENLIDIIWSNPYFLLNLLVQIIVAFTYNLYRKDIAVSPYDHPLLASLTLAQYRVVIYLVLLQPLLARLISVPQEYLGYIPIWSFVLLFLDFVTFFFCKLRNVFKVLRSFYFTTRYMVNNYGLQSFAEAQWSRLHIPQVLRLFWITRTCIGVFKLLNLAYSKSGEITVTNLEEIATHQLVSGCETVIALLGMTSIISWAAHYVGLVLTSFLRSDSEDDRNMGTMSAILFFILALQTGLTGLPPPMRLTRLAKNLCLLGTAVLHFIHSSLHPLLLNLSATGGSVRRHWRPLSLCAVLLAVPALLLQWLWARHSASTWLFAVSAFSIEVMVKVVISLLVYGLFMFDASSDVFWEGLDDYVYAITATGNTVEFLFGIFLFCNGAWILFFESGGAIRALMMCIHAYYNIWVQAKEGWKTFKQRRSAVAKINSLPRATVSELEAHREDVCAICYQPLGASARVTPCRHFFHGVCLRKWLYVQDSCPLCHHLIYSAPGSEDGGDAPRAENNNEPADGNHLHQD